MPIEVIGILLIISVMLLVNGLLLLIIDDYKKLIIWSFPPFLILGTWLGISLTYPWAIDRELIVKVCSVENNDGSSTQIVNLNNEIINLNKKLGKKIDTDEVKIKIYKKYYIGILYIDSKKTGEILDIEPYKDESKTSH